MRQPGQDGLANWQFWRHVDDSGDCWTWTGAVTSNGYGSWKPFGGKTTGAHRQSWIWLRGEIPPGMQIDHLCRNRVCVNPFHMEVVTQAENLRRRPARDTCVNGHPRVPGQRCNPCNAEAQRRWWRRKTA